MTRPLATAALAAAFVAAAAAPALAAPDARDAHFIKQAVMGDTGEIEMGRMAERKGASPAVRAFGRRLVSDHTKSRRQAEMVARRMGVNAPEVAAPEARETARKLAGLSGREFDRQAAQAAVEDHQKDIAEFREEARTGHGPAAEHARKTLPTLQAHLDMAQKLGG